MSEQPGVEELRGRIERTRADLGETVGALAAKVDVKARASGAMHDAVGGARTKAQNAVGGVKGAVGTATSKGRNAVGTATSKGRDAVGTATSKAQGAVGNARSRSQDAVASARTTAQGMASGARGRARSLAGHSGRHSAGSPTIEGDTALVTRPQPDTQAQIEGVLLVTSVGALVSALVVWLTRPRS